MNISFQVKNNWQAEIVICPVFEKEDISQSYKELAEIAPYIQIAPALFDFEAKNGNLCLVHGLPSHTIPRVLFVGLGKRENYKQSSMQDALAKALKETKKLRFNNVAFDPSVLLNLNEQAFYNGVLALLLSTYEFLEYKTNKTDPDSFYPNPNNLYVLVSSNLTDNNLSDLVIKAEAVFTAIKLARNLTNEPANKLNPKEFSNIAEKVAKTNKLGYKLLKKSDLEKENMHAFLSVGKGSNNEAYLAILEYKVENSEPIILVGKGICFDSGGISLKPSSGMEEMKTDMSGAAVVLGVIEAIAKLAPKQSVIACLALTENMPDANATRPGDIVTAYNGKTIEIVNTDAEGRLVLCDTLAYVQKNYSSAVIIDIATLTGACVVALGEKIAGLFANDNELANNFIQTAKESNEDYWQLPLSEHFKESIKSDCADLVNAGSRSGGTIFAAMFLQEFIEKGRKWIHLDIAGTARSSKASSICQKGGTGFGVQSIIDYILKQA